MRIAHGKGRGWRLLTQASLRDKPRKVAIIGAGLAGWSTAWNLLNHKEVQEIHVYTAGPAASAVAAGLLHPLNTQGNIAWKGLEGYQASQKQFDRVEALTGKEIRCTTGLMKLARDEKVLSKFRLNTENVLNNALSSDVACDGFSGLMYIDQCTAVNSPLYLEAMHEACLKLAQDNKQKVETKLTKLTSLSSIDNDGYDALVVCVGAAYGTISELKNLLPLSIKKAYTVDCISNGNAGNVESPYCKEFEEPTNGSHSILGSMYIIRNNEDRAILGSIQEPHASFEDALSCQHYDHDKLDKNLTDKAQRLLEKGLNHWPSLSQYRLSTLHAGTRASSPDKYGRIPLQGKLSMDGISTPVWIFTGLGARGLLYHALLGKMLSHALVEDDENALPEEVLQWKKSLN